ncbi:MAG: HK97 family phage prohead protease [Pseudomonadota bacterium]
MTIEGRFPYNRPAVLSDGGRTGRPRKERVAPGAFNFTIEDEDRDIHFLAGHSFDRPLASKRSGTLTFRDTATALTMAATITPAILRAGYAQDTVAQVESGLVTGLSPGFRMPPERAVPREEAEDVEEEPDRPAEGMNAALIRTIKQAILVEFSIVTRPAYPEAQVEARCWQPQRVRQLADLMPRIHRHALRRWRA